MDQGDHPQNIYDDPQFFAGYTQLDRFKAGWGRAMEHPDFLKLLGDASGRRVLDLGCGGGQLAFHLAESGATHVIGIDASERMLEVARTQRPHPRVSYRQMTMEDADFSAGIFDLVVSSLALHYMCDYTGLVKRISRWLSQGGLLVFSTEHPINTSRYSDDGWVIGSDGKRMGWAIDHYAEEGMREHHWYVSGVRRYHRTISTLLNGLIDAGLTVERVVEPVPSEDWLREKPFDADERRRPIFLLIRARKA